MDQIVGQSRAIDSLQRQLGQDRLHHAWIFHGPAGVGKFTTAVAFAKVVLCHDRQTDLAGRVTACGACGSCRWFGAGTAAVGEDGGEQAGTGYGGQSAGAFGDPGHPDLHVVRKELAFYSDDRSTRTRKLLNIPINVVREHLIEPAQRSAQLGRGKVFIVDEAELLDDRSGVTQNALLKTMEEPPAGTMIVLVTSNEDRLLPTVRSRCQRVAFAALPDAVLEERLPVLVERWRDAAQAEIERGEASLAEATSKKAREPLEQQLAMARGRLANLRRATDDAVTRHRLIAFAAGSLGRLELALRFDLLEWFDAVLPAVEGLTKLRMAPQLGSGIAERIDAFAEAWVKQHKNASKDAANKQAAALMWSLITGYAQEQIARQAEHVDPADPVRGEMLVEPWLGVIEAVQKVEQMIRSNVMLKLACDYLVVDMTRSLAPLAKMKS